MFNLISFEPDIDKIYLYAKDPDETKYHFLINKQESTHLKNLNDSKASIEYSNDMDDSYKNIEEYNPNKKQKTLIVFTNIIPDMLSNKKHNQIVTELFIKGEKLSISLFCITQFCFVGPKNIRTSYMHYFIMKIPKKRVLQQIAFNHSSDIDFMNLYKKLTAKSYLPFAINTTFESDNFPCFKKNVL